MIEAKGISKRYRDGAGHLTAVREVNIRINPGEFVLILGRSGSGKSTLLSMLGGLTKPDEGRVVFDGEDLWALPDGRISRIRAEKLGFIFQFSGLIPTLTAFDNVMVPSLFSGSPDICAQRATGILSSFGLAEKLNSYPSQLSGGELKRVAIARSLINDPSVILADEPTGDLDVNTEKTIMEYIRQINHEGKTIVMVTHNPALSRYSDKVFRVEDGILSEVTDNSGTQEPGLSGRNFVSKPAVM